MGIEDKKTCILIDTNIFLEVLLKEVVNRI